MHMYLGVNVCVHLRVNITVPAACKSSASASPFPPSGLLRKKNPALRCLSQGLPMPNIIRQDNLKLKFLCVNRAKFRTGTPDLHAHGFRYKCLCAYTHMDVGINVCVRLRVNMAVPAAPPSSASASPFPASGGSLAVCLSQGLPICQI